jgi:hypothetical protein
MAPRNYARQRIIKFQFWQSTGWKLRSRPAHSRNNGVAEGGAESKANEWPTKHAYHIAYCSICPIKLDGPEVQCVSHIITTASGPNILALNISKNIFFRGDKEGT